MRRKAFTLSELLIAMGLMVALLAGAGVVFHSAVQAQRTSIALSEIMRKFRGITNQLDADFEEGRLQKDGQIMMVWQPGPNGNGGYDRFDRVMLFATGGFQTYNEQPVTNPPGSPERITGNMARICYMLAKDKDGIFPQNQSKEKRILSRTQHILSAENRFTAGPDFAPFVQADFETHNFDLEYDNTYDGNATVANWPKLLQAERADALTMITGVQVNPSTIPAGTGGTMVDPTDPSTIHMLLSEGVGQFMVQGWGVDINADGIIAGNEARWFPETDMVGNGNLSDGDLFDLTSTSVAGLIYPDWVCDSRTITYPVASINEANFNSIPGLGRALKFTFTLYDSRGIYKNGKTFTHIIWL